MSTAPVMSQPVHPAAAQAAFQELGDLLHQALDFDSLSVCILDDSGQKFLVFAVTGDRERRGTLTKIVKVSEPALQSPVENGGCTRELAQTAHLEGAWEWLLDPPGRAGLIVPVSLFGRVIGTLNFGRAEPFTDGDMQVAQRSAASFVHRISELALFHKMELWESTARSSYHRLVEFSRVGNLIVQEKDLDRICNLFMESLREHSVFRRGILTLLDEELKGYKWFFFGMSDEEIEYFHSHASNKMTREQRSGIFQERHRVGNSFYIPAADKVQTGVRSRGSTGDVVEWHPDDRLFIPLYGSHKRMVGIVAVDDPSDGRVPTAETISSLELFANQVAHAIEEKKLDQEVKKSTVKYKTLVDTMNDGLVVMDLAERITLVNPTLCKLVGYRVEEMIGSSLYTFLSEKSRALVQAKKDERRLGIKSRYEVELASKDAIAIPVIMSGAPLYENKRLVGSFAVISDLREQKKSETEFRKMHQEIVDANEKLRASVGQLETTQEQLVQAEKLSAVGELVSGVAHELNNPLTGVLGYAQLLMAKDTPPEVHTQLGTIHKEAERCKKIVQNLLTFARKHKPEKSSIDINQIIEATLELRAYQLRVDNIEIKKDLAPGLPQTMGDSFQIQQVLINIVNNAHQAMVEHQGGGCLEISSSVENGKLVATLADNGPGIPDPEMGKIFDPFFTTKDVGKGTGLGLSLSYGIMQEHGGSIVASRRSSGGSIFRLELPIREDMAAAKKREKKLPSILPTGKRILVVDDEELIQKLLADLLTSRGHEVVVAGDGRAALEEIQGKSAGFDLVITDMKMPVMDGRELYGAIQAAAPDLAARVVFSTGDTVSSDVRSFLESTGNHFISKPFHLEEVDVIMASLFDDPRPESDPEERHGGGEGRVARAPGESGK